MTDDEILLAFEPSDREVDILTGIEEDRFDVLQDMDDLSAPFMCKIVNPLLHFAVRVSSLHRDDVFICHLNEKELLDWLDPDHARLLVRDHFI